MAKQSKQQEDRPSIHDVEPQDLTRAGMAPTTEQIQKSVALPDLPPAGEKGSVPEGYVMLFSPYPSYTVYLEKSRKTQAVGQDGQTVTQYTPGRVVEFRKNKALVPAEDVERLRKFNRQFGVDFYPENDLRKKLLGPGPEASRAEKIEHRKKFKKFADNVVMRRNFHDGGSKAEFFSILEECRKERVGGVRQYGRNAGVDELPEGW